MNIAYILLGGNLGDREKTLAKARMLIEQEVGAILEQSSLYQTAAWGVRNQPDFLNQVIKVPTNFSALSLLDEVLKIEKRLGRKRRHKWHARTIDIDILYFNDELSQSKRLALPHPEMVNRMFTLIPLAEIAPDIKHPILGKSSLELVEQCTDNLPVKLYKILGKAAS